MHDLLPLSSWPLCRSEFWSNALHLWPSCPLSLFTTPLTVIMKSLTLYISAATDVCFHPKQRAVRRLQWWKRVWTPTTTTPLFTLTWFRTNWRTCVWSWPSGTKRSFWVTSFWEEFDSALGEVERKKTTLLHMNDLHRNYCFFFPCKDI